MSVASSIPFRSNCNVDLPLCRVCADFVFGVLDFQFDKASDRSTYPLSHGHDKDSSARVAQFVVPPAADMAFLVRCDRRITLLIYIYYHNNSYRLTLRHT